MELKKCYETPVKFNMNATSDMSNVKPIFSFLPHFGGNIVVILCTGRYGPCHDLFYY